jgi:hypothetical protein
MVDRTTGMVSARLQALLLYKVPVLGLRRVTQ